MMGTIVTIQLPRGGSDEALERAFQWFYDIERTCTRFDPESELMRLTARPGEAFPASPLLFEAVRFAAGVAAETGGAFDPTIGGFMEARGFNREFRTGSEIRSLSVAENASYRDIELDEARRTILLRKPLLLDLGAVAKGLAVDAAAHELAPLGDFAIYAGGDVFAGGANAAGQPWRVGIRHPCHPDGIMACLLVSDQAVCTSGDYARPGHILDPRRGASTAASVASATVVAPTTLLADSLATAAFVLGPEEGISLLRRMGVQGLIVTPDLERFETEGLRYAD
jgi:thiamine biosynthesis lipoprotein